MNVSKVSIKNIFVVIAIATLIIVGTFAGYMMMKREEPKPTITPSTSPIPTWFLRSIEPSKTVEEVPREHFPRLYPWLLSRSDSFNSMRYPGALPRNLSVLLKVRVSVDAEDKRPVVENNLIFLADEEGIYALNRVDGELVWGVEVYFDHLEFRAESYPQPVYKWRALGLDRFVVSYGIGRYLYVATSGSAENYNPLILALDKGSGDVIWMRELILENNTSYRSITSNMVLADGKIFVGDNYGHVFCVSEDGDILWRSSGRGATLGLAYGDQMLYAVTSSSLYAINSSRGDILWEYPCHLCSIPLYHNGTVFLEDSGYLLALSRDGELVWRKNLGTWKSVDEDPYIALGRNAIYISRGLGEEPREFYIVDLNGTIINRFTLSLGEYPVKPLVADDIVILPVKCYGEDFDKVYILWRNGEKLSEIKLQRSENWKSSIADPYPIAIAAYGEVYVVEDPYTLYRLGDAIKPRIRNITARIDGISRKLVADVEAWDSESALYRVLLVCSINDSKWMYRDMDIARRYIAEPIGGYGYREELYSTEIDVTPNTTIEFYIIVIDNTGNYIVSNIYAYEVLEDRHT